MTERLLALVAAAVAVLAMMALWAAGGDGLRALVAANLGASGVDSAVTAVLLNFRGFDTLLEVIVVAAAVGGVMSLAPSDTPLAACPSSSPLAAWFVPRLVPVAGLFAVYLLWAGASRPGGAFQAGAVLAGTLLLLGSFGRFDAQRHAVHAAALAGPLLFLAVATASLGFGLAFLQYPPGAAKPLILLVETVLTFALGGGLALLAVGGRPRR